MRRWRVPFRAVVEAEACITAATRAEALAVFRARGWDYQTDGDTLRVTKAGAVVDDGPADP